jgi:hypothetical protein
LTKRNKHGLAQRQAARLARAARRSAMRRQHRERVLYRFESAKGQIYIGYCVWPADCSSAEQAVSNAFASYWINKKRSWSLLCRTMQKTHRSQWRLEVLEIISASRARARKTALIKKFRSSENDGGLNCANGRGQVVSRYSRLRRSKEFSGTGNPNARANPRRIKELSKTLSSPKVAKILGISKKTVQRHLRGEFGRSKYAGQS